MQTNIRTTVSNVNTTDLDFAVIIHSFRFGGKTYRPDLLLLHSTMYKLHPDYVTTRSFPVPLGAGYRDAMMLREHLIASFYSSNVQALMTCTPLASLRVHDRVVQYRAGQIKEVGLIMDAYQSPLTSTSVVDSTCSIYVLHYARIALNIDRDSRDRANISAFRKALNTGLLPVNYWFEKFSVSPKMHNATRVGFTEPITFNHSFPID